MTFSETKKKLLKSLRECPIIAHENFCLYKSGYAGRDFFDIDVFLGSPEKQREIVDGYFEQIDKLNVEFDKFGFLDKGPGPTGIISSAYAFSQKYEKEMVILRLREEYRLPHLQVKGYIKNEKEYPLKKGDSLLLVEDVITQGNTTIKAMDIVKGFEADVVGIVAALNRNPKVIEKIAKEYKIKTASIFTRDELVNLGYMLPAEDELVNENFIHRTVSEVFSSSDLSSQKISEIEREIDQTLEREINKMLKTYNIKIDKDRMLNIKNLYMVNIMHGITTIEPHL